MGLTLKLAAQGERYLPDIGDNRTAADPVVATINSPTVEVWQEYQNRIIERRQAVAAAQQIRFEDAKLPALNAEIEGPLFASCITALQGVTLEDGTAITTGAELWALRQTLDREGASGLMVDLLNAIFARATLDTGAIKNLERASGSVDSLTQTNGTVPTVASEDSM